MPNKINLITGETYTLGELFSGNRRIIIPDLQRDYCWGNKDEKPGSVSLVDGFIETLVKQFETHPYGQLSLGLIYGYESPADYIQLCDGQQRITTLFLLIGMLNRWSGDDRYRHYLMSDFEFFEDDHEPYLQYSIRESSLYFMIDLVYRYFTNGGEKKYKDINSIYDSNTHQSCSWFYGEYATDPSIISMLQCLSSIESKKEQFLPGKQSDEIDRFVEFLVNRLTFIYYDMDSRAKGEETFVVINTTGEPLSATENLKPLVLNAQINKPFENALISVNHKQLTLPKAWEEMENFFWKNRAKDKFDTADNGFNEFLRWVTLLENYNSSNLTIFKEIAKEESSYRFPYEDISIKQIAEYFDTLQRLLRLRERYPKYDFYEVMNPGSGDKLTQRQLFVLLPIIAYLHKHTYPHPRQVRRLWEFLRNLIRIDNVGKTVNDLLSDVIKIGFTITDTIDILAMNAISQTILSKEEALKLSIQQQCPDGASRCSLEKDIWKAQKLEVDAMGQNLFEGEIMPLLKMASPECTLDPAKFSPASFKHYLNALSRILTTGDNDLTRRALLAYGYKGFPWGKSYGWKSNWRSILSINPKAFRCFIDEVTATSTESIIANSKSKNPIIRYRGLLSYSDQKNFDTWKVSGYNVCKSSYAKPIPVVLGVIMARLGLEIRRGWQSRYGWHLNINNDGILEFTPDNQYSCPINIITVSSVEGGTRLRYEVTASDYNFSVTHHLASADDLIEWISTGHWRANVKTSHKRLRKKFVNHRCNFSKVHASYRCNGHKDR